jgi:hypothetical protein
MQEMVVPQETVARVVSAEQTSQEVQAQSLVTVVLVLSQLLVVLQVKVQV